LINTTLSFGNDKEKVSESISIIDPWAVWVLMTVLATLLLLDWVIKENRLSLRQRLPYSRTSMKQYFVMNGIIYTALLLIIDLVTVFILSRMFSFSFTSSLLFTIINYRFMLNIIVFLISLMFKIVYPFYI